METTYADITENIHFWTEKCMVCLHSTTSDSWVDGQSWARGPNLGHLWVVFIESIVFEHYVVLRIDFLSVTSDLRVQCPRVLLEVKI